MILGLCSTYPQVGKTTCANYLKKNLKFEKIEMSDQIVKFAIKYLGYNGNKLDLNQRSILQSVGRSWKDLYPDIWLYHNLYGRHKENVGESYDPTFQNYLFAKHQIKTNGIESFFPDIEWHNRNIVICGVRGVKEVEEIKELGGCVFLIERPEVKPKEVHSVESELNEYNEFDEIIVNDGNVDQLLDKVFNIMCNKHGF